jgi:hypothetical protein
METSRDWWRSEREREKREAACRVSWKVKGSRESTWLAEAHNQQEKLVYYTHNIRNSSVCILEKRAWCHDRLWLADWLAVPWESFGVVSCSSSFDLDSSVFTLTVCIKESVYRTSCYIFFKIIFISILYTNLKMTRSFHSPLKKTDVWPSFDDKGRCKHKFANELLVCW